ncbi:Rv0340 family IniB-related protein [[Mycobacterium] wendilense]|uniref:Rv0340 family protein n=1 Tax=[Mycobacterium] wendilense TaxID=3064284 RepID=A0ABM9MIN9_9MYCO|nr:Rv0340 family IniB-related protein [Mycolicibacterium sp. MU0050]CAJ1586121.1 Rv0340 family protein [Mycolicibacterium sp. MU0050]
MANELLDFVMSLVRDPEVAARYAADPAGTLADANLANVTSVDVDNLIPVVSDSLSMATPSFGATAVPIDDSVWTSGAAAQAVEAFDGLDAFAPPVPETGLAGFEDVPAGVIDSPQVPAVADAAQFSQVSDLIDEPDLAAVGDADVAEPVSWDQGVIDSPMSGAQGPADEAPGFDLF